MEALYDLIDNAIDAARERRLADGQNQLDHYGLPSDYSGSRIRVRVGRDSVTLSDNCTGIDEETLATHVFVTGFVSEHQYGIGGFGIGLKRALFRLGTNYVLSTDTGTSAAEMRFDRSQLGEIESTLTARRVASSGTARTLVSICGFEAGVKHELNNMSPADFAKQFSRRYGIFISKGLRIVVNGLHVPSFGPGLRKSGPLQVKSQSLRTPQGVDIFVESGMHEEYRLRHESDHVAANTARLTDQYGWYFVCNDRIVKIASHEKELGWAANWHPEYYGFVGWVRFVAWDPELLPWDTKKTQIDPHSPSFREVSGKLQEFAEAYKAGNKKARKQKLTEEPGPKGDRQPIPLSPGDNPPAAGNRADKDPPTGTKSKGKSQSVPLRNAEDHNEHWNTLLPPIEVVLSHPKIRAMVFEATDLPVGNPYAAAMLFRAIMEFAAFERLKLASKYQNVRNMYFEQQNKAGRALTETQKKTYRPTFAIAMEWLNKNDDFFPVEVRRECVTARNKFGAHLKELNGVVHEGDLIDSGKLKIIRNDTLPLLRFFLGR